MTNLSHYEIERKFLVTELPENLGDYPHKEIIQGYLAISEKMNEVRVRNRDNEYFLTIKSGFGKIRQEIEIKITIKQFNLIWEAIIGKRIEKTRYVIPYSYKFIELDIYHGDLEGLLTAEIEFESEEESIKILLPEWLGKEVTEDKRYKNQYLALNGSPKIV